jgi:CBS domain-containing protein
LPFRFVRPKDDRADEREIDRSRPSREDDHHESTQSDENARGHGPGRRHPSGRRTIDDREVGRRTSGRERLRKLVGIVSESDYYTLKEQGVPFSLFRAPQLFGRWLDSGGVKRACEAAAATPVRDVMVTSVITIDADASVEDILRAMLDRDLHRIPVVSGGKVVGLITRHDLLRGMASAWPATVAAV